MVAAFLGMWSAEHMNLDAFPVTDLKASSADQVTQGINDSERVRRRRDAFDVAHGDTAWPLIIALVRARRHALHTDSLSVSGDVLTALASRQHHVRSGHGPALWVT